MAGASASAVIVRPMSMQDMMRPAPGLPRLAEPPVSRLMYLLWQSREDLRRAFDLSRREGQAGLVRWYDAACLDRPKVRRAGSRSADMVARLRVRTAAAWDGLFRARRWLPKTWRRAGKGVAILVGAALARASARGEQGSGAAAVLPEVARRAGDAGFNLIGHVRGELGLGQNLRYAAAALAAGGLPCQLVDFSTGVPARRHAAPLEGEAGAQDPYRVNVFLMSPGRLADAFCHFGHEFFSRHRNVLYAFWELERWPEPWREWLHMFDEIWVPSRFVEGAVAAVAPCPVYRMPACVELPASSGKEPRDLGLPSGRFLFLAIADAFSYLERKNPLAAILAFKRAFPAHRDDVGLVVKAMNVDRDDPHWLRVVAESSKDPRIVLIYRTFPFADMVALYRATDCLVSLHRAEGLGMCMAEAMVCGKPVIATRYSGSLDITPGEYACLVDAHMVAVQPGQYPFHAGQVWAEPDIGQAAEHMRRLCDEQGLAAAIGAKAGDWARDTFAPRAAARAFAAAHARLRQ